MNKELLKQEAEAALQALDKQIDALQKRLSPVVAEMKDDAKIVACEVADKSLAELHRQRAKLQERYGEIQKAVGEKQEELMHHFRKHYKEVQARADAHWSVVWEKLRTIFD